jgi:hypothetical protein
MGCTRDEKKNHGLKTVVLYHGQFQGFPDADFYAARFMASCPLNTKE